PFAKIIAVACAFEAITSPQKYQKSRGDHAAVIELLKSTNTQFDPNVIKALISIISLYPIGTYVRLTNGQSGRVVDISTMHIKMPIVQVQQDNSHEPLLIKTYESDIKIERSLTNREIASLQSGI
ncbi:MAG: HD-GYP domain-containing protein, partial [Treponemataceae bacterium]